MQHVTRDGLTIEVGRVDRRQLDKVAIPKPVPPSREIETWGGVTETVPVYDDSGYQRQVVKWINAQRFATLRACLPAIRFTIPDHATIAEMRAARIDGDKNDHWLFIRYCLSASDKQAVAELVYYQSTVTERGLAEAAQRLAYTWRGKPVDSWTIPATFGMRGDIGHAMQAAYRSNLTWNQFCDLAGPEQSFIVKFWNLEDKLAWLCLNAR